MLHRNSDRALPKSLERQFDLVLSDFHKSCGVELSAWLDGKYQQDRTFAAHLRLLWSCSEFVAESCVLYPALLRELVTSGDLERDYRRGELLGRVRRTLADADDEVTLHRLLRQLRRREMVRIVWRDFTRLAGMEITTAAVTDLADSVITATLDWLYPRLCEQRGTPAGRRSGQPQRLMVLGMGKQGAWELNVSSDIDLIFVYPEDGETTGGRRPCSNQEFFTRLGQQLIKALDTPTADGFVFRVDMRLRPYGQSGALVASFDAIEEYYQSQGRDWERYAMIKARVVTGDAAAGEELMATLRPFVYRRYIDFGVIESLRDMKAMIRREVALKGLEHDIKRGVGGIREVEFIAQAFQLIRGGKDHRFQQQQLRPVLALIGSEGLLSVDAVKKLYEAYRFLRNVEHVLQGWRDQQTQSLPTRESDRRRVSWVMGFADWPSFSAELARHRDLVAGIFADVVTPLDEPLAEEPLLTIDAWNERAGEAREQALHRLGYDDAAAARHHLESLQAGHGFAALQTEARRRLDRLMPQLVQACAHCENSSETLQRVLGLVQAVLRRSAYLLLLAENPPALRQLVTLCSQSLWVAEQLRYYPALLDELLDSRTLYTPATPEQLQQELRDRLLAIPEDDLESQVEVLRYFKLSHSLRVAACEVTGVLPLMKVSDNLTWLAEIIIGQVVNLAWAQMRRRHGDPGGDSADFIVVGYGKLGGIELAHGSDLDLVFLHNADTSLVSDGERSLDNAKYFVRLAQKVIHILTTRTAIGMLYDVDTRLRPSGDSGLLVTTLAAFDRYQEQDAWVWEHQALVRARPLVGDTGLIAEFEAVRRRILGQPRDIEVLRGEVLAMRAKMREHLGGKTGSTGFHLKQDPGGIVDIEFMVQFAVLAWAPVWPELARWSDNIRILETLSEGQMLSPGTAERLIDAYKTYRTAAHRLQLQHLPDLVAADDFIEEREFVLALWRELLGDSPRP